MTLSATADRQNRPEGRMTGGRALAEMLRLSGAGPMFGMGGFQLLPFYDALGQLGMRHFLINDERCGAFAADAYARVTNRPGICDGTLGPGATNLVTGLVESLNGGIPVVAIAGNTNRAHSWKNMTQECRQAEILKPAVKELIRVEQTSRVPELTRRAFAIATSGRPGPVLLDVPEDVCHGAHDFTAEDFAIDPSTLAIPARRIRPDRADIDRAAGLIAAAKRPLLLVGGGIHLSQGYAALLAFAEAQAIPVAHTMSGKGRPGRSGARRLGRGDPPPHGGLGGRGLAAPQFARPADPYGTAVPRAEPRLAGRGDPGRRWRLRRALDRPPLRHEAPGPAFHPGSRLRLDRLRPARRHRRGDGGAGNTRRFADRRWRLQHDARRIGDRAPRWARPDHRRPQQT